MTAVTPFRRHSTSSFSTRSEENVYLTPAFTHSPDYEGLMLAPRKKKPIVLTRRSSAPASLLDCRDIRKRLDFDVASVTTRRTIDVRCKRKCSMDSGFINSHNEMTSAFADLTITPKSSKRVKFLTEVERVCYSKYGDDWGCLQPQPSSSKATKFDFDDVIDTPNRSKNPNDENIECDDVTPESEAFDRILARKAFTDGRGVAVSPFEDSCDPTNVSDNCFLNTSFISRKKGFRRPSHDASQIDTVMEKPYGRDIARDLNLAWEESSM